MTRIFPVAALGFAISSVHACAPLPQREICPALPKVEAVVRPRGADVRINGIVTTCPQPLAQQDMIVTGAASSATVQFADGTTIMIPENTDPLFSWGPTTSGSKGTVNVVLDEGWSGIVTGYRYSVRVVTKLSSGLYFSRGAVQASATRTTAYLFDGNLRVERPLPARNVAPMQLFETGTGVPTRVRAITEAEQRRVAAVFGGRLISPPAAQTTVSPAKPPQPVATTPPQPTATTPTPTVKPPPPPLKKFNPKATVPPPQPKVL